MLGKPKSYKQCDYRMEIHVLKVSEVMPVMILPHPLLISLGKPSATNNQIKILLKLDYK